ncbi:MAG: DUF6034 family protein, partial [Acetanaerobacterium sp.]
MKKTIITGIAFLCLLLSACQATPEKDIVVQQDQNLSEAVSGDADVNTYQYPSQWKDEVTYDASPVTVSIDAQIQMPTIKTLPVYRCNTNVALPQSVIDTAIKEFFGDSTITDKNSQSTKTEMQDDILDYQKRISDLRAKEGSQDDIAFFEEMIEDLQKRLPNAPDRADNQPVNTDIGLTNDNGSHGFSGTGSGKNGHDISISVKSQDKNAKNSILIISQQADMAGTSDTADMHKSDGTITQEDAVAQAQALVERLGIGNMQFTGANFSGCYDGVFSNTPTEYGYVVTFTRVADGVICHTGNYMSISKSQDYSPAIVNETVSVGLTFGGVWSFTWDGYFELGEKQVDNAALLSFDEIQEAFKNSMKLCYSNKEKIGGRTQFRLKSIVLGYSKTAVKNEQGACMLMPVWNFYGEALGQNGTWYEDDYPMMSI